MTRLAHVPWSLLLAIILLFGMARLAITEDDPPPTVPPKLPIVGNDPTAKAETPPAFTVPGAETPTDPDPDKVTIPGIPALPADNDPAGNPSSSGFSLPPATPSGSGTGRTDRETAKSPTTRATPIVILPRDGTIRLQAAAELPERQVTLEELRRFVPFYHRFILRADGSISYEKMAEVLLLLRQADKGRSITRVESLAQPGADPSAKNAETKSTPSTVENRFVVAVARDRSFVFWDKWLQPKAVTVKELLDLVPDEAEVIVHASSDVDFATVAEVIQALHQRKASIAMTSLNYPDQLSSVEPAGTPASENLPLLPGGDPAAQNVPLTTDPIRGKRPQTVDTGRLPMPGTAFPNSLGPQPGAASGTGDGSGPVATGMSSVAPRAQSRDRYQAVENRAREIADRLRQGKTISDADRAALRENVRRAFEARQDLLRDELGEFQQRLDRLAKMLDGREREKNALIERRLQDLLNPDLEWSAGDPLDSKSPAQKQPPGGLNPFSSDPRNPAWPHSPNAFGPPRTDSALPGIPPHSTDGNSAPPGSSPGYPGSNFGPPTGTPMIPGASSPNELPRTSLSRYSLAPSGTNAVPPAEKLSLKIFPLKFTPAPDVAKTLNDLASAESFTMRMSADATTNTIIVFAGEADLKVIETLINHLEKTAEAQGKSAKPAGPPSGGSDAVPGNKPIPPGTKSAPPPDAANDLKSRTGLEVRPVTREELGDPGFGDGLRLTGGVKITAIRAGSPAEKAGLKVDDIIVGAHVWEVRTVENLLFALSHAGDASPDTPVNHIKVYVRRGSKSLEVLIARLVTN